MIEDSNGYAYGVESVPTDKGDCVRQNRTADGISRGDADTGHHGLFGRFSDETRVQFDEVRVFVQVSELVRHFLHDG